MKLIIALAALSFATASLAAQPPAPVGAPAAKPAKPKKICREDEARTGSHMGGGRTCKTAEQWRELDGLDADTTTMTGNSPTASSAKHDN